MAAARVLADLYARTRLFVNVFQPSFKLAGKERAGARVRKRYHPPATPCDRLLADPRTPEVVRARAEALRADLDPVRLLADIRHAQRALVAIAPQIAAFPSMAPVTGIPVADFLVGLRTAWQVGEVRPTAQPKTKPKRGRRRPDPLVAVTGELRDWFEADPSQSGAELLADCRRRTPKPTRMDCSARYSVVSESGAVKKHRTDCHSCEPRLCNDGFGNIDVRQRGIRAGTLLGEAIRLRIQIVALQ